MKRAVVFVGLGLALLGGCAKAELEDTDPPREMFTSPEGVPMCPCPGSTEPDAAPIDEVLLAFLSKARAAHHQADVAEGMGDRTKAIGALEGLVGGPVPGDGEPRAEAAEVLADTRARLADLRSADGAYVDALRDVELGLALAKEPTHFRGHLFEVRGIVEERRSRALEEEGKDVEAKEAKRAAMEAFEAAIDVQDDVIRRALDEPATP